MDDAQLAADVAATAGALLLALRRPGLLQGKALGAAGDAVAQAWIARALTAQRPEDAILSEEAVADPARLGVSRVWVVDPLDGTREYAEGRADWAVHVALVIDGHAAVAAVAVPDLGLVHQSHPAPDLPVWTGSPFRIVVSRTRPPAVAMAVATALGAELVSMGSAGVKVSAVLRGEAHAYMHAGGQYEWDSAAPVGVAQRAGLHVSRLDGSPLVYNRPDPLLPDLLVCRRELADDLLSAVVSYGRSQRQEA